MKPGKLYIKIFLSFLAVLLITEIIIFALFILIPGRYFRDRIEHYNKAKVLIAEKVVGDMIGSAPTTDLSKNKQVKDFILDFGRIMGAKVWLQNIDGTLPVKSFRGGIPKIVEELKKRRSRDYGSFRLYHQRHFDYYAVIPIAFPDGEKSTIHILFDRQGPPRPEGYFALGLAIIGLVIALLIIPISRFITERVKQLRESALHIAEGDLSHRVTVKGKDEISDLGRAFNQMADKLERMIVSSKELTANVSHELRTPLTRIRISEEILREKLEQGNVKGYQRHLDDILEDIRGLDRLIGHILELSKMDIHESPLRFEILNPSDLIHDLLERLKPIIERKDLHIKTDLSFHSPFMGDKEALHTAFLNILGNAAKFTPEKGDVIVTMYSEQGFLKISVTNSFEELAEEDLSRIFGPFHRAERSNAAGSGLGLAITKKIIERHGGNIKAVNSPEGLEIRIRLPAEPSRV